MIHQYMIHLTYVHCAHGITQPAQVGKGQQHDGAHVGSIENHTPE